MCSHKGSKEMNKKVINDKLVQEIYLDLLYD